MRYFGGAVAFGFAAVWIMASLAAAGVCLLSAAIGYGIVLLAQRTRAKLIARVGSPDLSTPSKVTRPSKTSKMKGLLLEADELNDDLGYVYDPSATTSPGATEGEYGWPPGDDTSEK